MMEKTDRVGNSTRNIVFSMAAYLIQILLGFFVRRYFIYYFGEEYLGISSLFSNILSLLSLAELGFGTAIVFAMYKPMADGDEEKVRELMQFYKKCYFIIGSIIAVVGLCVLPFMGYFKTKAQNVEINLYAVYLINLFNTVISYFFAHRRSLLYTNQRNDIESKTNMFLNVLSTGLQFLVIFFVQNYYLYVAITGVITIANNIFIYFVTQRMYPQYLKKPSSYLDPETRKSINKNIRAMIFHKIGTVIVFSTDSLVIFLILGSAVLGKYSNYLLITTYVSSFIILIINALRGSVGNSVASESVEKNYSLYKKLNFLYLWIISFCTVCIYVLADPFIDVVLVKSDNVNLLLDRTTLVLISASFFFTYSRNMTSLFKECAGIFYQDRYKPLIESLINLIVSIVLGYYMGVAGVLIGTIVSCVTTSLWIEPYMLNKHYMKKSTLIYFAKYLAFVVATIIASWFTWFVCHKLPVGGITLLLARFAICVFVPNIVFVVLLWWLPEFRECLLFMIDIIRKVVEKKQGDKIVVLKTESIDIDSNGVPDTVKTVVVKKDE